MAGGPCDVIATSAIAVHNLTTGTCKIENAQQVFLVICIRLY